MTKYKLKGVAGSNVPTKLPMERLGFFLAHCLGINAHRFLYSSVLLLTNPVSSSKTQFSAQNLPEIHYV